MWLCLSCNTQSFTRQKRRKRIKRRRRKRRWRWIAKIFYKVIWYYLIVMIILFSGDNKHYVVTIMKSTVKLRGVWWPWTYFCQAKFYPIQVHGGMHVFLICFCKNIFIMHFKIQCIAISKHYVTVYKLFLYDWLSQGVDLFWQLFLDGHAVAGHLVSSRNFSSRLGAIHS